MNNLRVVWVATLLIGCRFDPSVKPGTVITCAKDTECPTGLVCSPRLNRCIAEGGDRGAPTLTLASVEPARARRGAVVHVSLTSNEPLFETPVLSLPRAALESKAPAESGETYTYTVTVGPEDVEGEYPITAGLTDLAGNEGVGRVGTLTLDFTEPTVLLPTVQIQPALARPGEKVLVQVAFSEPLMAAPTLTAGSGPALQALQYAGALAVFQVPVAADAPDGALMFTIDPFTDVAGNTAAAVAIGQVRIDTLAPRLTTLEISSGAQVRSAQPGFNTFVVTVEGDAGPSEPLRSLDVRFLGQPLVCDSPSPNRRTCAVTVLATMPEGEASIQAMAVDAAGNTEISTTSVRLDFSAPRIAVGTLQRTLVASDEAQLVSISALGEGGGLILSFTLNEPVSANPVVSIGGAALPCTSSGQSYTCEYLHHCSGLSDGAHDVQISVADLVGNAVTGTAGTGAQFTTDCVRPMAPRVGVAGLVEWWRAPWGASWSSTLPLSKLVLAPGATAEPGLTVEVGTLRSSGDFVVIKRALVDPAVATDILVEDGADRPEVSVRAIDRAGNASGSVVVRSNVFVGELFGRDASPTAPGLRVRDSQAEVLSNSLGTAWSAPGVAQSSMRLKVDRLEVPIGRTGAAIAPLPGGRALLLGGTTINDQQVPGSSVFNAYTGRWHSTAGPQPTARTRAQLCALNDGRVLLHGGLGAGAASATDSWVFEPDTETWVALTGPQPPPRTGHRLASLGEQGALLFGFPLTAAAVGESWLFNGATNTWERTAIGSSPPAGIAGQLVALPGGRAMIFGSAPGGTGSQTWQYSASNERWAAPTLSLAPPLRTEFQLVSVGNKVLLVGGRESGQPASDDWLFDADSSTWARLGTTPLALRRTEHSATALGTSNVIVWGGQPNSEPWVLEVSSAPFVWRPVSSASAFVGVTDGALAPLTNGDVVAFGGQRSGPTFNTTETWLFAPDATGTLVTGETPAAPSRRAVARQSAGALSIVPDATQTALETWSFDAFKLRWLPGLTGTPISMRTNPGLASFGPSSAVLFGGHQGSFTNDTLTWANDRWSVDVRPAPSQLTPRWMSLMAELGGTPRTVLLYGGSGPTARNDSWTYDTQQGWQAVVAPQLPALDGAALLAFGNDSALLVGGLNGTMLSADSYVFSLANRGWVKVIGGLQLPARRDALLANTGEGPLLFGGLDGSVSNRRTDSYLFEGGKWVAIAGPGPGALEEASLTSTSEGRALLIGQVNAEVQTWVFTPGVRTWSRVSSNELEAQASALPVRLSNDSTLVIRGYSQTANSIASADHIIQLDGAATGAMGSLALETLGIKPARVTSQGAAVFAGANGGQSATGFAVDLFRTSTTGRQFQQCGTQPAATPTAPLRLTCAGLPSTGAAHVALRIRPLGFSNAKEQLVNIVSASLEIRYGAGP